MESLTLSILLPAPAWEWLKKQAESYSVGVDALIQGLVDGYVHEGTKEEPHVPKLGEPEHLVALATAYHELQSTRIQILDELSRYSVGVDSPNFNILINRLVQPDGASLALKLIRMLGLTPSEPEPSPVIEPAPPEQEPEPTVEFVPVPTSPHLEHLSGDKPREVKFEDLVEQYNEFCSSLSWRHKALMERSISNLSTKEQRDFAGRNPMDWLGEYLDCRDVYHFTLRDRLLKRGEEAAPLWNALDRGLGAQRAKDILSQVSRDGKAEDYEKALECMAVSPDFDSSFLEYLKRIPPREADALRMYLLDDMTQAEIATKLGMTQAGISYLIARAKERIGFMRNMPGDQTTTNENYDGSSSDAIDQATV
jgi:RNA polymerase sigma factor (sigma-70 family)